MWTAANVKFLTNESVWRKEELIVMGVDVSLDATGVTIINSSSSDVIHSETITHDEVCYHPQKLHHIMETIDRLIGEYGVQAICFEAITVSTNFTALRAVSYAAGIVLALSQAYNSVEFIASVNVSQIKKYATGKGKGVTKQQVMDGVQEKYGLSFDDDNQTDAFVAARIFIDTLDKVGEMFNERAFLPAQIQKFWKGKNEPQEQVVKAILEKSEWMRLNNESQAQEHHKEIVDAQKR